METDTMVLWKWERPDQGKENMLIAENIGEGKWRLTLTVRKRSQTWRASLDVEATADQLACMKEGTAPDDFWYQERNTNVRDADLQFVASRFRPIGTSPRDFFWSVNHLDTSEGRGETFEVVDEISISERFLKTSGLLSLPIASAKLELVAA